METNKKRGGAKNSLLKRWLDKKNKKGSQQVTGNQTPGIRKRPEANKAPLSYGQQRLWFLQQLNPDNPFYNYAENYLLEGALDKQHLADAFQDLIKQHEILRTCFVQDDNSQLSQHIQPSMPLLMEFFDLCNISEEERTHKAGQIAFQEAEKPFDLEKGPLMRVALIKLANHRHLMLICMHHIITDKWSMRIVRKDLSQFYTARSKGQALSVNPPTVQYADFAYWQRKQEVSQKELAYWKNKLEGSLPVLNLPVDRQRNGNPDYKGAYLPQSLPFDLSVALKALSKQLGTTPFVLLLTAYKILLHRYSGQIDLLIGTPITDRDQRVLEEMIGFFNNTVVLRSDLSGDPPFSSLVQQVRQTTLDAFSHKNTPFEEIVRSLKPERYTSSNPLFQAMFLYHKVPESPSFGPTLQISHQPFDLGVAKFDLTLYISEEDDQLKAIFEYATDLFERSTIEQMQGHLQTLLQGIVKDPNTPISQIPILTEPERKKLISDWNNTATTLPDASNIQGFFKQHAQQQPEAPAVICQGEVLTYGQLDEQSDCLAIQLRKAGLSQNQGVGLCAGRSFDMIIGIWGILKAGGAYIPIDPEYPTDRIRFMLKDAKASIILTEARYRELFSDQQAELLLIQDLANTPSDNVELPNVAIDHHAYIIYTSGSTGLPKGVPVTHRNLIHSTAARFDFYPNQPGRFLLLSSFAFDSSVVGLFWPLCTGGAIVLPPKRIEQDVDQLAGLIAEHEVTHTLMLPSLYRLLLQYAAAEQLASLNTVMVAGEACSAVLCGLHFETLPQADLFNEYGPTEASVWCTAHQIQPEDAVGSIPIGRPIANTQIYILDQHLQAVPAGISGELYVGGIGVTQGYLNRPDLTEERFIPDPFSQAAGAKLYKTGDLARYRSDGLIDFLGRADHQVKIRGYRIELDEIRERILQQDGISEAVVVARAEANHPKF
ncbi:MAG: amino acid adenylation domain-containing protein, partial [Bacteroidota bacterium]